MSTEPKLLVAIINKKDVPNFLKIDKTIFKTEDGKKGYEFISKYYKEYQTIPSTEVFKEYFPNFAYNPEYDNPEFYYSELLKYSARYELAKVLQEASASFNNKEPIEDIAANIRNKINNLSIKKSTEKVVDIRDNIEKRFDELLSRQAMEEKEKVYTMGHPYLDRMGTIDTASVNLILGRYGSGKSWLGLYLASKYWRRGLNPLFISIEMPGRQIEERLDSILSGTSYARLLEGTLYADELEKFKKYVNELKEDKTASRLNIVAPNKCSINTVRELCMEYKPGAVFIDYIQLMKDDNKAKEKRIALGNIANDAKALAKELEIPIFFIVQANRTAEDEVPTGNHIKECDEIGAAADMILSLYQTKDLREALQMELHITKFRNGQTGGYVTVPWCFESMHMMDCKHPFNFSNPNDYQ